MTLSTLLLLQVALTEENESFALIYSVEDPRGNTPLSGIGVQVMGPDDGYMMQFDQNVQRFWAERNKLALGSCFERNTGQSVAKRMVSKVIMLEIGMGVTLSLIAASTAWISHIYFASAEILVEQDWESKEPMDQ